MKEYFAKPDRTIEEHAADLLKRLEVLKKYGYIEHKVYDLVRLACLYHDNGKMNPQFQIRVVSEKRIKFNREKEIPHNVLSGFLLNRDEFDSDEDYYSVLFAIMYHHDYGDPYEIASNEKELIRELLEGFTMYRLNRRTLNGMQRMLFNNTAVKVKGYLHKCDYSASGCYEVEFPNDFLERSLENVKKKWQSQNPESDWNELQKFCISKRADNIIVVAQTGMGKTEAGLQWIGNRKGYFVLPLRTAINGIYDRVRKDILLDKKIDTRLSIMHSESFEYYSGHLTEMEMDLAEYENRGKRFSIPLNISTVDQLFDFVFKYQGYELKLTTLSYSKIVVDEIQMYDAELLAYLIFGLKRIVELGGKVAIMTATLSPFIKDLLMREINYREENICTFTNDLVRHNVKVIDDRIQSEDIFQFYCENKKKGGANKILVVCNSIKKTQQIYEELRGEIEQTEELHILHSRFIKAERADKEKEILEFGKTYGENGELDIQSGIWVSTSLVEASLDIDFDYLFTELQDLNSLFQRLGRCNRKGEKEHVKYNCFVYLETEKGLLSSSKNGFIDDTIFFLSQEAMKTVDGELSEKQKLKLLDHYLTMENLKESDYYRKYKETIEWIGNIEPYKYTRDESRLRNILSEDIIPAVIYEQMKETLVDSASVFEERGKEAFEYMRAKENIMRYTVNIPYYEWLRYRKAVREGKADSYPTVDMGKYGSVSVMDCCYDELGYHKMDYENQIREANIF